MRTGRYHKVGQGKGRSWYVMVDGTERPAPGESVLVQRRDNTQDVVTIKQLSEGSPGAWVCLFTRTNQREFHPTPTPQVSVSPDGGISIADAQEDAEVPRSTPAPSPVASPTGPSLHVAPESHKGNGDELARILASVVGGPIIEQAAQQAARVVESRMASAIEEIAKRVADMQDAQSRPLQVTVNALAPVTLTEHRHPLFEKVLRLVNAGVNVLLVGDAGTGKTFLAHQVARALSRKFGTVHCTAGMSESHVSGWLLPTGDSGRFEYHPAEFVSLYAEGNSVFLLDEIDAADPNVLMFLNGALANGALHIPHRLQGSYVERGAAQGIMAAANTFGHGATSKYQGRGALDGATLDRFYTVEMDYDRSLESAIMGESYKSQVWKPVPDPSEADIADLGHWVLNLRNSVRTAKLGRIVSTRTIQKAITARRAGLSSDEIKADLLAGWTQDERTRAGV